MPAAETRLPHLQGEFLSGRKALLPEASAGKVALLALGFTYDSRFAVEAWVGRFRKDFGTINQVTFFEVPVISGMARMGKWFIDSGMRSGTPKADHEHVITVYGGGAEWKKFTSCTDPNYAYLILLDQDGVVRWMHGGMFAEDKFQELAVAVRGLIGKA